MKTRLLICLFISLFLAMPGCKKDPPAPAETNQTPTVAAAQAEKATPAVTAVQPEAASPTVAAQQAEPTTPAETAETPDPDSDEQIEYFAVFMEGKKVGHAVHTRSVSEDKVKTSEAVSLTIKRMGVSLTINMSESGIETTEGKPLSFEVEQELSAMVSTIKGVVDPNGTIFVTTKSMGTEQKSSMPWPEGAVMAEGLRLLTESKGAAEGLEYEVKVFNAASAGALDVKISFGPKKDIDLLGRIVSLREVTKTYEMPGAGQIRSTSYMDDELRVLKDSIPLAGMSIEILACTKEFALGENDVLELINKMFVTSPTEITNLGSVESIRYHLKQKGPDAITAENFPSGDNQTAEGTAAGDIFLTVNPAEPPSGVSFPYSGSDESLLEALKPTSFLQCEDPTVVRLAKQAVGDTKDAAEAAAKIEAFVADYMTAADLSVGYASAAEVASSKQGDCSEFAVLAAAMCRAVGIPSQVVVGVAYVEDFQGIQGFGGHAWIQANIGGKWIGFDAAFKSSGRGGYDAGHIALAAGNGEPADFFNLATTLGRFDVTKVEVKRK